VKERPGIRRRLVLVDRRRSATITRSILRLSIRRRSERTVMSRRGLFGTRRRKAPPGRLQSSTRIWLTTRLSQVREPSQRSENGETMRSEFSAQLRRRQLTQRSVLHCNLATSTVASGELSQTSAGMTSGGQLGEAHGVRLFLAVLNTRRVTQPFD
jgi:hypothetical protein